MAKAATKTTKTIDATETKVAALNADTDAIISTIETIGGDIHTHLCNLATHVIKHGDVTPMGRFLIGLTRIKSGNSTAIIRADACRVWAKVFGFTLIKTNKDGAVSVSFDKSMRDLSETELKAHIVRMRRTKWNEFKTDPTWRKFDLTKRVESLIKSAIEAANDTDLPEGKTHDIPADLLEALKALAPTK